MSLFRISSHSRVLCGVVTALGLMISACAPKHDSYRAPTFAFFSKYKAAPAGHPVLLKNSAWWHELDDPVLNRLIDVALSDSISLKIARERVVAARAARAVVPGGWMLTSNAAARSEEINGNGPVLSGPVELGLSWMLDPWGARRDQLRAADARIEVAEAEVGAARLLLIYNVALAHLDLRYRQRLLTLVRQDLGRARRTLDEARALENAGEGTRIEVIQAQARVVSLQTDLPTLQANITGRVNEITVLIGHAPGRLPDDISRALVRFAGQPQPRMSSQIGIPADLLRNRPDIHMAEREYYAAVTEIGVARSSLYPTLSLTGLISLNTLGPASNRPDYYFGPSLVFPSLPTQNTRARVALRESEARQAHEAWRSTVLDAIGEVENALIEYDAAGTALSLAVRVARLYRETETLTRAVVQSGEGTVSDLIDVQQDVSAADHRIADLIQQRGQGFVEINVRLGAGHRVENVNSR